MAAHARFKNEFTEDEKNHNHMSWLFLCLLRDANVKWLEVPWSSG